MIDSVALVWGQRPPTPDVDRVERPSGRRGLGRHAESPPVYLRWPELLERFGTDDGQVRSIRYGDAAPVFGHWEVGDVGILYQDGRLELRASLPKLVAGANDVVLDEPGVRAGLTELVRLGRELLGIELELDRAAPARLDYAYQWPVPSVAWVLEHLRSSFRPGRYEQLRTENISPLGGRSLVWGYGGRRVVRMYDKRGEIAEGLFRAGELRRPRSHERGCACHLCRPPELGIDTLLRYEVQDRRRPVLRRIHEAGYPAALVHEELCRPITMLAMIAAADLGQLLEGLEGKAAAISAVARSLFFVEHDEAWPVFRRVLPRRTYYRWRRHAREIAAMRMLAVGDWTPAIPLEAFRPSSLSADLAAVA